MTNNAGVIIAIFLTSIFAFVGRASACTCGELALAQQRDNATAIFLGRVISKERSDAVEKNGAEVTLKVDRVWKGRIEKNVIVYTGATDDLYPFVNLCATPFRIGESYLVFTYGADKLATDVCTGTAGVSDAKGVIKQMGKGKRPLTIKKRMGTR
jgi:hypothetical protein